MTLLTTAELKQHVETDLADTALSRLLDASERQIIDVAGDNPIATSTQRFHFFGYPSGQVRSIFLPRAATSIVKIEERDHPDDTPITLAADDFQFVGQRQILRLREGTNPRLLWAKVTDVEYNPVDDSDLRKLVQVNLVKIALNFQGFESETVGDVKFSHPEMAKAVNDALAPLRSGRSRWPVV